jgi:hypothetical protein
MSQISDSTIEPRSLGMSRFKESKSKANLKLRCANNVLVLGKLMQEIYYQSPSFCKEVTEKKSLIFLNQLLGMG